jgi:SAM-dependent methyltransferase
VVNAQNSTAEFYDDIYRANPRKWGNIAYRDAVAFGALNLALGRPPKRVLDYGCGNGHTLAYFRERWKEAHYTGVDISPVALELARERVPDGEYHTEIPAKMWDVITIMGVAEHFEDPAAELRRIAGFLPPDGLLYLEVPNCLAYSKDKGEGFRQTYEGAGQIEWHWQRKTWEQAIKAAGLEVVHAYKGPTPTWEFIWVLRNE